MTSLNIFQPPKFGVLARQKKSLGGHIIYRDDQLRKTHPYEITKIYKSLRYTNHESRVWKSMAVPRLSWFGASDASSRSPKWMGKSWFSSGQKIWLSWVSYIIWFPVVDFKKSMTRPADTQKSVVHNSYPMGENQLWVSL